jgi:hypothetical protein
LAEPRGDKGGKFMVDLLILVGAMAFFILSWGYVLAAERF